MKQSTKLVSLFLAVMLAFSAVFASGCSLNKEWAYKSGDKELAIGVYIYELDTAYNRALNYAKDQLGDEYDSTKSDWLDKEITDDDGNKAVAREWIKQQAEKACIEFFAYEQAIKELGATVDEAALAAAQEQSTEYWNVGQYAQYGYIMPMKDDLEPYGISLESFTYCTAEYSTLYNTLLAALYEAGGTQEVKDSELVDYVNDKYVSYSYFSVNLYESTTDEAGESTSVALSADAVKKIEDELKGYVKDIDGGKSFDDVADAYAQANGLDSSPANTTTELAENFSMGDEMKEAVDKLKNNKATTVKVGEGDTAIMYIVYKNDIKSVSADYTAQNRTTLLSEYKSDDFKKYIEDYAKKVEYEKSGAVDGYDPKMFFVKVDPTTTAAAEDTDEESAAE